MELKILNRKTEILLFVITFLMMLSYLFPIESMISLSADAEGTWNVAKTFFSDKPENSYVMYKGFLAIYPNVFLYYLASFFKLEEFFFLKIFNSLLFAYLFSIGIPNFFSKFSNFNPKLLERVIFILISFFFFRRNFSCLSIDALSMVIFVLTVNFSVKFFNSKDVKVISCFFLGILLSASSLCSGQYFPAAILCGIYIFAKILKLVRRDKKKTLIIFLFLFLGFSSMQIIENNFMQSRVIPLRESGVWLPEGKDWLKFALTNNMLYAKFDFEATIPDNRGKAILINESVNIDSVISGVFSYGFKDYIALILKYPFDFMIRWVSRFVLSLSVADNNHSIPFIFLMYTFIFESLIILKEKCRRIGDAINLKTLIILSWILPSLVPIPMHVEMRYFMSIQTLIVGAAILSGEFFKNISTIFVSFKNFRIRNVKDVKINYSFLIYICLIILCFTIYSLNFDLMGADPIILYK